MISSSSAETTLTVTPAVKTKNGTSVATNDSDFSEWKLVLLYQGTDTNANGADKIAKRNSQTRSR